VGDCAALPLFDMDGAIEFRAGLVVRRDDKGSFRLLGVGLRDGFNACVVVRDLMHAALLIELGDRVVDFAARELLDGFFQCRIFLPDDFIQARRLHSGLLQLLVRPARIDRLVLAYIADQNDTVIVL
jgi:hypothetical protein